MARKPRIHVPGGYYHVVLRGNSRQDIFFTNYDRQLWESLISKGVDRYEHRIHAYCWMTNHIHIAIQAAAEPLANFISFVASNYARKINLKTRRTGHLFERRYRAIIIDADSYLQELVRYIHLNPVRAMIVAHPAEYRWSSHHAYVGKPGPDWLTVTEVLQTFGPTLNSARRRYKKFINQPQETSLIDPIRLGNDDDSRMLGSDAWLERVLNKTVDQFATESLDDLIRATCLRYSVSECDLRSTSRARDLAAIRAEIALAAVEKRIATVSAVARHFGRSQPSVSRSMNRLRNARNKL